MRRQRGDHLPLLVVGAAGEVGVFGRRQRFAEKVAVPGSLDEPKDFDSDGLIGVSIQSEHAVAHGLFKDGFQAGQNIQPHFWVNRAAPLDGQIVGLVGAHVEQRLDAFELFLQVWLFMRAE